MSNRVVIISHNDGPVSDRISGFFLHHGFETVTHRPFQGDDLPAMDKTVAGSIILGGKFDADDVEKHPFLIKEQQWVAECLSADIPLLGICQGAQQIAHHLGAKIGVLEKSQPEFGYYEIMPTAEAGEIIPAKMFVPQFHYHTFEIPKGAIRLAGSEQYPNQAFRFGERVFGIQWHSEVTPQELVEWRKFLDDEQLAQSTQNVGEQNALGELHDKGQAEWFDGFLFELFGRAADSSDPEQV